MKARIIFGTLIVISLGWIGYTLWLVDKHHQPLSIESYFSDESSVYIINRADNCLPEIPEISIHGFNVKQFIQDPHSFYYWKSISIQTDSTGSVFKLLLEEKSNLKDQYLTEFLETLSLNGEQYISHKPYHINGFFVCRANGYLAISTSPISNQENQVQAPFATRISRRDIHASFSIINRNETIESYCFRDFNKHYHSFDVENAVQAKAVNELDMYSVLPSFTKGFYFIEKNTLLQLLSEWDDQSFVNYIDRGIIYAKIDQKPVVFIDIVGQYVPQEIITEFAQDKSMVNSQIIMLNRSIGTLTLPYATGIENILVLCEDKDVLERIRLAYQMGDSYSKTKSFEDLKNHGAQQVHFRWQSPIDIAIPVLSNFKSSFMGYGIYQQGNQLAVSFVQQENVKNEVVETQGKFGTVSWNFTLENKNSQFYQNNQAVCVYNPDKKTVSIVDVHGKVSTWMQLNENVKTIHPMENGFLIEQFNQLIWMADAPPFDKKEIPFKGAIASSIASYIWKGVPSISLISENKLYRISLRTGKSELTNIPSDNHVKKGQLHAFNHEGDLSFGVFTDSLLHIFNSKKDRWTTTLLPHKVVWSKKINGKIYYLAQTNQGYNYQELFKPTQSQLITTDYPYFNSSYDDGNSYFIFHSATNVEVYSTLDKSKNMFTISHPNPEMIYPIHHNNKLTGIISLNGIQNTMEVSRLESQINSAKNILNASQFIKFVKTNKVITFVDGQLVMYNL